MGLFSKIGGVLLGKKAKSKSESESKNLAYDQLSGIYSPQAQGGVNSYNQLGAALGQNGGFEGQRGAFQNFLNDSGFDFIQDEAEQGLINSNAGRYFLRSGATAKGLQDRRMNITKTYFDNWLDRLAQMSQLGLGAGGLIANAGQYSKSTGNQTGGSQGILGPLLSAGAAIAGSDRRMKADIKRVGELGDGLGLYNFRYRSDEPGTVRRGVMADEVATLRPWALGPVVDGYQYVDYGAL